VEINKQHFEELKALHGGQDNEDLSLSAQRERFRRKTGRDTQLDDDSIIAASCHEDDGPDDALLVSAIQTIEREGYTLVDPDQLH